MLKAISFGTNTPDNRLNIVQRNGKRICLALTIEIDVIGERIKEDLNSEAAVNFSVSEIPIEVAKKVIADTAEGQPAIFVLEYNKQVEPHIHSAVSAFVGKCVRAVS
ncbi:hypothetical protein [Rhizobium sp.]|uniref:hypothetical protein n=1 Tax=Rhizobium sp. TaxID=391 RepID=UPI0028ADF061